MDRKPSGRGASEYVAAKETAAKGIGQAATVVAFELGHCSGDRVYRGVKWYLPEHGQRINPDQYEDISTGAFVTGTASAATCPSSQIDAKDGRYVGGGTGEQSMTIALVNSGPDTCALDG